ncbi:unnamed protein product [Adineta steineri]|uniref:NHL repeat containing protein-like protein n=1 Tax=Adineta steineri TaxID=433720 RepID=A0A818QN98_9BILA|nr:unnamed protein product [Adineta steineri]
MVLCDDISALNNVSSYAYWAVNGTTVTGKANGTSGSAVGYLTKNEGIFIADDDTLYIGDAGNNRIVVVPLNSMSNISIIGDGYGSNLSQFYYPSGVFVTAAYIYIMDAYNHRVQRWLRNGTNPVTIPVRPYMDYAYFLFIDKYSNLYLGDCGYSQVLRFSPNSSSPTIVAGNGTAGSTASQLFCPLGVFVDDSETVYVADYSNHRIQKWAYGASFGVTVAGNGLNGNSLMQLNYPKSVVVDTNGYMYIVDTGNNRIVKWAPNANSGVCIIACSGVSGNQMNQLSGPVSLAFDSQGSIYIGDMGNNRVQKFAYINNTGPTTTTIQMKFTSPLSNLIVSSTNGTKTTISSTQMVTSRILTNATVRIISTSTTPMQSAITIRSASTSPMISIMAITAVIMISHLYTFNF